MFKIDLHTHILPPEWPNLAEKYGYGRWVQMVRQHDGAGACCGARLLIDGEPFRDIKANCFDHAVRLQEIDELGVGVQVLSTVPVMFSYWAQPEHTLELSRHLNDHIAGVCREHPKRFVGLGTLPMQAPELAVRELERCVKELGLAGVEIGSHVEQPRSRDWNLSEPALFPIFQAAEELGAAVFIHPWAMMGEKDMSKYWLPWLVGMPAETARAICSVLFSGVLDRLPKLRVCFAHGGGSFPFTIGRIEAGYNCRPDLVAVDIARNPWSYLAEPGKPADFYVDSLVHSRNALRYLIALMDERRIAMGSDYPFPLGEQRAGAMIDSMYDLTDPTKRRLLAGTALEFLGLDPRSFIEDAEELKHYLPRDENFVGAAAAPGRGR
ncbi:MAG: amidohydrolase family protein [Phycisphaerales bacterium JB039]